MSEAEKTSVAALISVILRRKANRVIDVKWLVKNQDYAREIINLCHEQGQDDLNEYASHLESLMFGAIAAAPVIAKPVVEAPPPEKATPVWNEEEIAEDDGGEIDPSKYVGHLR